MKKIINYEKDLIFKTNIAEICSISLEEDFTIDDGVFKGDFILEGEYKTNELSVNKEPFSYRLPIEYEFEKSVKYETINYEIENFEYKVEDDVLNITIDLGLTYDEENEDIPLITEEELNLEMPREGMEETITSDTLEKEEKSIIKNDYSEETFTKYHVHIVRSEDTLDSIAKKYGTTIDNIKKYNDVDNIELKSKLIIPECDND